MAEDEAPWPEAPWPMGESDGSAPTPLIFSPKGFLVMILEDAEGAVRAKEALARGGFADADLRVYTAQQILADHESYVAQQSAARRIVREVTTDPETPALYFGYARDGRSALWVESPKETKPAAPSVASLIARSCTSGTTATTEARKTSTWGDRHSRVTNYWISPRWAAEDHHSERDVY